MKTYKDLLQKAEEIKQVYSNHSIQYTIEYFESTDPIMRRVLKTMGIPLHSKGVQMKFRNLELYNSEQTPKEATAARIAKSKQTKLEKYGDANYNNRDKAIKTQVELYGGVGLASPIIASRAKETCLNTYGVDNPAKADVVKQKTKQTCEERFGGTSPFSSSVVIEKINNTCEERYGVSSRGAIPSRIAHAKETAMNNWGANNYCNRVQAHQTMLDRYGVEHAMQNDTIKQHASQVIQALYGVAWNCMRPEARHYGSNNSGPNSQFELLLANNSIDFTREFAVGSYSYDFKIGNTLVEINPSITHNSTWTPYGDHSGVDSDYHYKKTRTAESHGYRCIHIWDWDNSSKIIAMLKNRETLYARKCVVEEVDVKTASEFINKHHLQNYARDNVRVALKYESEIVSIMTFGKPRYNKKCEWELIRYCSSKNIVGGAQKLFTYFVNNYNPKSIVSYCDRSKFSGETYTRLGFTSDNKYAPSRHWWSDKLKKHITNNLLLKHGFDQLFKTNYGINTSNEQLMYDHGFLDVYDAGQETYTWNNIKLAKASFGNW